MHVFEVWAPTAERGVAVRVQGQDHPLEEQDRGWWSARIDFAQPGDDYQFILDAAIPCPIRARPGSPKASTVRRG